MQRPKRALYFSEEARLVDTKCIKKALARHGSITQAATYFGIARNTLLKRMDELGLRNGKAKKR